MFTYSNSRSVGHLYPTTTRSSWAANPAFRQVEQATIGFITDHLPDLIPCPSLTTSTLSLIPLDFFVLEVDSVTSADMTYDGIGVVSSEP
jgi:hypothetical protein